MATKDQSQNQLWKPDKEARRAISSGERKIKAANERILEENLKAMAARAPHG